MPQEERDRSPEWIEVPPPPPADEDFAAMEARVRLKLERRDPLTPEERRFFAHLNADHEVSAYRVTHPDAPE